MRRRARPSWRSAAGIGNVDAVERGGWAGQGVLRCTRWICRSEAARERHARDASGESARRAWISFDAISARSSSPAPRPRAGGAVRGRSRTGCRAAGRICRAAARRRRSGCAGPAGPAGCRGSARRPARPRPRTGRSAGSRASRTPSRAGFPATGRPTRALNHWRVEVSSEIRAIGEPVTIEARRARRSKRGSLGAVDQAAGGQRGEARAFVCPAPGSRARRRGWYSVIVARIRRLVAGVVAVHQALDQATGGCGGGRPGFSRTGSRRFPSRSGRYWWPRPSRRATSLVVRIGSSSLRLLCITSSHPVRQ